MTTTLALLAVGDTAKVTALGATGATKRRLMDMGLLPGATVKVIKVAPLGDPIEVTLRSYNLSLRKQEAEAISVEVQR